MFHGNVKTKNGANQGLLIASVTIDPRRREGDVRIRCNSLSRRWILDSRLTTTSPYVCGMKQIIQPYTPSSPSQKVAKYRSAHSVKPSPPSGVGVNSPNTGPLSVAYMSIRMKQPSFLPSILTFFTISSQH